MSKQHEQYTYNNFGGFGSSKPTLPNLIVLILILLQFGRNFNFGSSEFGREAVDNGILFIIALFYLSCCNPCRTNNFGCC